jgi:hypothetical protein
MAVKVFAERPQTAASALVWVVVQAALQQVWSVVSELLRGWSTMEARK